MSKFIDENGLISWLFSQVALLMAAGILLASIAGITFYNDWQKEAEARAAAQNFVSFLSNIDLMPYSCTLQYFPPKDCSIWLSRDYVMATRHGRMIRNISVSIPLMTHIFIGNIAPWKNSTDLHKYFVHNYQHSGNISDPIPKKYMKEIEGYLYGEMEEIGREISVKPFRLYSKPLWVEKEFIYFENGKSIPILIAWQEENEYMER